MPEYLPGRDPNLRVTFNNWIASQRVPSWSRTLPAAAFQASAEIPARADGKYEETWANYFRAIPDEIFYDSTNGNIFLAPHVFSPGFWGNEDDSNIYGLDDLNYQSGELTQMTPGKSLHTQGGILAGDIRSGIDSSVPKRNEWRDDIAGNLVWIAETKDIFVVNEAVSFVYRVYNTPHAWAESRLGEDTINVAALAIGDYIFATNEFGVLKIFYLFTKDDGSKEWRFIKGIKMTAQPFKGGADYQITVIPSAGDSLLVYMSGSAINVKPKTGSKSGNLIAQRIKLMEHGIPAPFDGPNDRIEVLRPGVVTIGISKYAPDTTNAEGRERGLAMSMSLAKCHFYPSATFWLAPIGLPESTFFVDSDGNPLGRLRTNKPTIELRGRRNGGGLSASTAWLPNATTTDGQVKQTAAFQANITMNGATPGASEIIGVIYTPFITAAEFDAPAEFNNPPAGYREWDVTRSIRKINFRTSSRRVANICDFDLVAGKTCTNDLLQESRTLFRGREWMDLFHTWKIELLRFVQDRGYWDYELHSLGEIAGRQTTPKTSVSFGKVDGYDVLYRLRTSAVGNLKALDFLTLRSVIEAICEAACIPKGRIHFASNLAEFDYVPFPDEWYHTIENMTCEDAMNKLLDFFVGQIRIRVAPFRTWDFSNPGAPVATQYWIKVYRRPDYRPGVDKLLRLVDADGYPMPATGYHARARYGVFKSKTPPEFESRGAEGHVFVGSGASSSGEDSRRMDVIYQTPMSRNYDPTDPDYEPVRKVQFIGIPKMAAATDGGVARMLENRYQRDSIPKRDCQIDAEWHPMMDVDVFIRLLSRDEYGVMDYGIFRIEDVDTEIIHHYLPESWRAKYSMTYEKPFVPGLDLELATSPGSG